MVDVFGGYILLVVFWRSFLVVVFSGHFHFRWFSVISVHF